MCHAVQRHESVSACKNEASPFRAGNSSWKIVLGLQRSRTQRSLFPRAARSPVHAILEFADHPAKPRPRQIVVAELVDLKRPGRAEVRFTDEVRSPREPAQVESTDAYARDCSHRRTDVTVVPPRRICPRADPEHETMAREKRLQDVVDDLRARLAIPDSVAVAIVPVNQLVVSVERSKTDPAASRCRSRTASFSA